MDKSTTGKRKNQFLWAVPLSGETLCIIVITMGTSQLLSVERSAVNSRLLCVSGDGVDPWRRSHNRCSFPVWRLFISCLWKHHSGDYSVSPWHSGIPEVRTSTFPDTGFKWRNTLHLISEWLNYCQWHEWRVLTLAVPKHWRQTRTGKLGFTGSAGSSEMGAGKYWGLWRWSASCHNRWRICRGYQCIHTGKNKQQQHVLTVFIIYFVHLLSDFMLLFLVNRQCLHKPKGCFRGQSFKAE